MSNRRSALYTLCLFEAFHPQGSVSLDSRVASLPYESSSLATSRGNEKYGEEKQRVIYFMYYSAVSPFGGERSEPITSMLIMPYDTKANPVTLTLYLSPPKGETTHYILRVASAPSPSAVTDSLDFQVADAPLQIQFA